MPSSALAALAGEPLKKTRTISLNADFLATVLETTALGAAWLAGHHAGVLPDAAGFSKLWRLSNRFTPKLDTNTREVRYAGWQRAVRATIAFAHE